MIEKEHARFIIGLVTIWLLFVGTLIFIAGYFIGTYMPL